MTVPVRRLRLHPARESSQASSDAMGLECSAAGATLHGSSGSSLIRFPQHPGAGSPLGTVALLPHPSHS